MEVGSGGGDGGEEWRWGVEVRSGGEMDYYLLRLLLVVLWLGSLQPLGIKSVHSFKNKTEGYREYREENRETLREEYREEYREYR